MEPAPAGSSPGVSSTPATTIISPSPNPTAKNVSTITGTCTDKAISCDYCTTKFKYGKKGRQGQKEYLRKHIRCIHPEMIPNYKQKVYRCSYNCGHESIYKRSIRTHEKRHCRVQKKAKSTLIESKDTTVQEQEHSELEVGTDAHSPEAQKSV